jgi:hypothetical protein
MSAVLEFESPASGGKRSAAIGVWTPPVQMPSAKLVHSQYNSPMQLYTPQNVADMIEKQTGTKLYVLACARPVMHTVHRTWQKKPTVRFVEDIRDSATYKLLHEIESMPAAHDTHTSTAHEPVFNQSRTIKRLAQVLHEES